MIEKYKTVNENDAIINPSVSTLFVGTTYSREKTIKKEDILKLIKYSLEHNSASEGVSWSTMEVDDEGEYIRLKDILDLFE